MCSVGPRRLAVELLGGAVFRRTDRVLRRPDGTLRQPFGLQLLVARDDPGDLFEATLDVPSGAALLIFVHGGNVRTQPNQARAGGRSRCIPQPCPAAKESSRAAGRPVTRESGR